MADKQFARSGPAEFDKLADDDPLSELARIVGYDARPAVQQLQELQRHQETIRRDPAFDLEDELLRAFDSYDAPRAAPVHPDSGLVEHPAATAAGSPEPVLESREPESQAPLMEPSAPAVERAAELSGEPVAFSPEEDQVPSDREADVFVTQDVDSAVDLERELELSLGYEDLSAEAAPVGDGMQPVQQPETPDLPVFEDWQEPLASRLAAAGKAAERAHIAEPVYLYMAEPEQPQEAAVTEAVAAHVSPALPPEPAAPEPVDRLLADVERFPIIPIVPAAAVAAASVAAQPAPAVSAPVAKKNTYPFTPMFSRATPVASAAGASQQRAYATPMPAPAAVQAPAPAVAPEAPAVREAEFAQNVAPQAESEPSFDLDDFELELADIALDMDLLKDDAPKAAAEAPPAVGHPALVEPEAQPFLQALAPVNAPKAVAEAPPVAGHPALVEPAAQPFLQALAPVSAPELRREQAPVSAVDQAPGVAEAVETSSESPLPFDPAMIGEMESGVAPIADLDVPQLPSLEAEEKPVSYPGDFDLDIDAEMAQLFNTPAPAAKSGRSSQADAAPAARAGSAGNGGAPLASLDDFEEFEKAMEEDFQRSMSERRSAAQDAERLAAMPRAESEDFAEQGYGRRSQRTMLLAASVAGVIILGGAAVYAWMGGSSAVLSGDGPRIILADKDPVKIVPEQKGGKTVPNQDKAVYDRVAGDQGTAPRQEALVSSTEEPMDVVQRTLTPESLPLEGSENGDALPGVSPPEEEEVARLTPDASADNAAAEEEAAPAVAPRKVRTMIVKPDGTLVPRDEPTESASAATAAAQPIPADASAEAGASGTEGKAAVAVAAAELRTAEEPAAPAGKVALAAPSEPAGNEVAPVRSVKTTAVGSEPTPSAKPAAEAPAAAAPEAKPATETAAAQPAAPLATASVPAGSYVVQIASLPSEAEAQKSYNNLSAKFASVIGGRGVDIRKAEIAGKGTYYRVRIPAGSREEANALCSRYKSAGGSCLVTK
ncbi:SPOR domain-containing protein [Sinorhizobium fredii]|uniref:Sporulation related domain-containing protein n=1 Tax=Rhizobium fredii TaxID=380 RepID=A0A2L0H3V7_RHIFR|nr:SPOR domain-containing protein [Sinorhizobium fredii]AUX76171.1 sporulation related domain-containing protein [Sinorhizobium fredii]